MATRLTPLGFILKWIVVPISLGAIGYFLVGPRVESKMPEDLKEKVKEFAGKNESSGGGKAPEDKDDAKPTRSFSEPEVDVTVTALNSRPTKPKRKRKRRSRPRVETPSAPTAPIEAPQSDPGGGGGGNGEPPPVTGGA